MQTPNAQALIMRTPTQRTPPNVQKEPDGERTACRALRDSVVPKQGSPKGEPPENAFSRSVLETWTLKTRTQTTDFQEIILPFRVEDRI